MKFPSTEVWNIIHRYILSLSEMLKLVAFVRNKAHHIAQRPDVYYYRPAQSCLQKYHDGWRLSIVSTRCQQQQLDSSRSRMFHSSRNGFKPITFVSTLDIHSIISLWLVQSCSKNNYLTLFAHWQCNYFLISIFHIRKAVKGRGLNVKRYYVYIVDIVVEQMTWSFAHPLPLQPCISWHKTSNVPWRTSVLSCRTPRVFAFPGESTKRYMLFKQYGSPARSTLQWNRQLDQLIRTNLNKTWTSSRFLDDWSTQTHFCCSIRLFISGNRAEGLILSSTRFPRACLTLSGKRWWLKVIPHQLQRQSKIPNNDGLNPYGEFNH